MRVTYETITADHTTTTIITKTIEGMMIEVASITKGQEAIMTKMIMLKAMVSI